MTLFAALIVTLAFDLPFQNIKKILFPKKPALITTNSNDSNSSNRVDEKPIQTSEEITFDSPFGDEEEYIPPKKLSFKPVEDSSEVIASNMNGSVHDTNSIVVNRIWDNEEDNTVSPIVKNRSSSPNFWDNK